VAVTELLTKTYISKTHLLAWIFNTY